MVPKITDRKQVKELCDRLKSIEKKAGLKAGLIGIEIMIETPLSIIDRKGNFALKGLVEAAKGRCTSAHFGAFGYTSALGISSTHQHLRHDACNFARQMMLLNLSPMGIRLSDSVTTLLPVAIHKSGRLSKSQIAENRRAVHEGWREHFSNVTESMKNGFYQSWDLHPNQLPARYAAVYAFFLESADAQASRLKEFLTKATQATLTGNTFDDAASAEGILNFFRRGVDCGAFSEKEIRDSTGLTAEELRSRTFQQIAEQRMAEANPDPDPT